MIRFFLAQVRGPLVLILAATSMLYGVFILQVLPLWSEMQAANGGRELQEMLFYTSGQAGAALSAYDAHVRRSAMSFYALDAVNAILFAVSIAALIAFALRRMHAPHSIARYAIWLPVLSGFFDLIENALLASALNFNPASPGFLGAAAGIATAIKLTTGMAAIAIMLILLISAAALHAYRQLNPITPDARQGPS
ncbi:MAG: hypothetical protein AB7O04_00490 [Hyphomonadaceae bacterium]